MSERCGGRAVGGRAPGLCGSAAEPGRGPAAPSKFMLQLHFLGEGGALNSPVMALLLPCWAQWGAGPPAPL